MKNIVKIILQISVLFIYYLAGSWIQKTLNLFVPASVIGLLLLFASLSLKIYPFKWIEDGAQFMTKHIILFFIPSTVGIIGYFSLFAGKGIFLVLITLISTIMVMVISGKTSEALLRGDRDG
ncbi:MAG TPA: CidA/LrgA family holin-like protein [Pseudogracilibacillus sp.]|nr:CidA/LrgA family holin-like protein [Pseudogracilibacillus sp.]